MEQKIYNSKDNRLILVLLLSLVTLAIFVNILGTSHLPFLSIRLNDAVGYISMARALFDNGHFNSNLIYPCLLNSDHSRLYMPGYYFALATAFRLFGVSIYSSILPSVISYISSGILIYAIGNKIYNRNTALVAAILFLFNPLVILLALSAMSELTIVLICLAVFYMFLITPDNLKYLIFPVLISLAFLFKQNTLLIAIPMLAVVNPKNIKWLCTIIFTAFLIFILNKWQILTGMRPWPMFSQNLFSIKTIDNGMNFSNLLYLSHDINLFFSNYMQNILTLKSSLASNSSYAPTEKYFILLMIISVLSSIILFFLIRPLDYFSLSIVLMYLIALNSGLCFYTGNLNALNRLTLFCFPFITINLASVLLYFNHLRPSTDVLSKYFKKYYVPIIIFLTFNVLFAIYCFTLIRQDITQFARDEINREQLINSIHPDKSQLFVGPVDFCGGYIYKNYPAKFSFIPRDYDTLVLLNQKYPIGTILFAKEVSTHLNTSDFNKTGFVLSEKIFLNGQEYFVYHKKRI